MPEDKKEVKDVEMKDAEKDKDGKEVEKKPEKKEAPPPDPKQVLVDTIVTALRLIQTAVSTGDNRLLTRVSRLLTTLRHTMLNEVLVAVVDELIDAKVPHKAQLLAYVPKDVVMAKEGEQPWELKLPLLTKPYPPEFEIFASVLLLMWLLDKKETDKSFECANVIVTRLKQYNRRTMDVLQARSYFFLSLAYERKGRLPEIRTELLAAYRTSCLRHDVAGQATMLNLLLRNYLSCNLYEQAMKLVTKTNFPESRPSAQYARYLFYIGTIKAVQLEYSDAHSKLMQAIRKAPQGTKVALGFKLIAYKLAIIVELLMGGIPDRSTFMQKELREHLRPYYAITQAVRSGDLNAFKNVMTKHETLFKKDKTLTLIHRLHYNVIKTGLRSINLSYSRIYLKDICDKLGLETPQDVSGIVSKAVVDGVIDATIDYEQKFVQSKQRDDLYSSCEPQKAFHKRIAFCLQMHNDTVKAMAYPDDDENKDGETAEERRQREKDQLASVDDDEDMDML